jgi:cysteine desulfurase
MNDQEAKSPVQPQQGEPLPQVPIYLDHHATTPCDPRVVQAMLPHFSSSYGNPASTTHEVGRDAARAVELARRQVAMLIGASPKEIVFTSGATESINLGLKGVVEARGVPSHIISATTEHAAVLDTLEYLTERGHRVSLLEVDTKGHLDLAQLEKAITEETALVSLMTANNEIGVIHSVADVGAICRERGVYLFTDAAQAAGQIPLDVNRLAVDLMALSGHKMYGPKGIGALYVRRRGPRVDLSSQLHGGGHERGRRSGTLNVPAIVGFGKAAELAQALIPEASERIGALRDRLLSGLEARLDHITVHGCMDARLPNNLNISIGGVEGRVLLELLPEVALSAGSACAANADRASHVLRGIGATDAMAFSAVRFGLGRDTTANEIERVVDRVAAVASQLRKP